MRKTGNLWIGAVLVALLVYPASVSAQRKADMERVSMDRLQRVFSLSVGSSNPSSLLLATPFGLFRAGTDGNARRVAGVDGVVMSFAVNPKNRKQMIVGGHPGKTGSIGVLASTDGGRKWRQISKDAAGSEGFHMLEFSKASPKTVYGMTKVLRVSEDGGRTWRGAGVLPQGLIHMAASAVDVKTVYAATRMGLQVSRDQGVTWKPAGLPGRMATMVHTTRDGRVYGFGVGAGFHVAQETDLRWRKLSNNFADRIFLRMAVDPADPKRLYAATVTGSVVTSADGGKTWIAYEGSHNARPKTIAKGAKLFAIYCQACHGEQGKGQHTTPNFDPKNPPPIAAPALDDSAHAWHHTDEGLITTILEGSPRKGSPMIAWKSQLSRKDAESLVAYVKSLWSFRSFACQGARHMACMKPR